MHALNEQTAILLAGIPASDMTLYHRMRFEVGDPAAWIGWHRDGVSGSQLIIRDIEMDRARRTARADAVGCPSDFAPKGGLSADRAIATAQAVAEFLVRNDFVEVVGHRDLPLLFVDCLHARGIGVVCDRDLGVLDRRAKDDEEVAALRSAQAATESAIRMACETIAHASVGSDGTLVHAGQPLTSERVRAMIDIHLIEQGLAPRPSIVAGGPQGADCHDHGSGVLRTGEPIIIDVFPRDPRTLYNGDCTRTVVHGDIPDDVRAMHEAVVNAKAAAIAETRAGRTAEAVHEGAIAIIRAHGFEIGLPADGESPRGRMTHGTGHGLGLDVHEPPLLDMAPDGHSPALVVGDALTIEPGVYDPRYGGIRIEDLVIVREDGAENLNTLPEGLAWK
jgi:Xaa-Pro aminopeptidase